VLTDVELAEVAEVAEEVARLTARLSAARRVAPPIAQLGEHVLVRQLGSPVSGRLNPIAPPVEMVAQPDGTVRCEFTLSAVYAGPPGLVHGGVSALILDHLLSYAAVVNGTPGMTATLDLRYLRPTPYGAPLTAEARTVRVDGRKTYVNAFIVGPEGKPTVEATAMFITPLH
jgi:uncharacterized protein (TIGR00369 family)